MFKSFSRKKSCISVFAVFFALLVLTATASANTVYPNAIIYSIDANGVVLFNVLYSSDITGAVIVDKTRSGINTVDNLKAVLGTPDAPAPVFGTNVGNRTIGKAVTGTLVIDQSLNKVVSLTITNVRERPLIGITKRTFTSTAPGTGNEIFWGGAFEKNGALVVYLDTVQNADGARDYLTKLNGIFVCGGEDWHPALYGETVSPHGSSGWNVGRDISDGNLIKQAVALDVPMLAACRGHQGFNIAMGGGLIQDVPYFLGEEVKAGRIAQSRVTGNSGGTTSTHRVYKLEDIISADGTLIPYSGTGAAPYTLVSCDISGCSRVQVDGIIHSGGTSYHRIDTGPNAGILPNSKWLYNIVGANFMPAVATAHHQSVNPKKLGTGITIVSYSTDGIAEAIEHQDSLFALGVQWHPERDAGGGTSGIRNGYIDPDSSNAFMRALVQYAGIHKDRQVAPNFVDPYAAYNDIELNAEKSTATVLQKDDSVTVTIADTFLENGNEIKLYFRAEGTSRNDAVVTVKLTGSSPFEVKLDSKSLSNAGLKNGFIYAVNYTNGKNVFGTTTFSKGFKFDYEEKNGCNTVYMALALLAIVPLLARRK